MIPTSDGASVRVGSEIKLKADFELGLELRVEDVIFGSAKFDSVDRAP